MIFQFLTMIMTANAQLEEGRQAKATAERNAFNIDTQKKMSQLEAKQRHNDRLELYRSNFSSNVAAFAATGRDVGDYNNTTQSGSSVAAFLKRQREVATDDTSRSDMMGRAEALKYQAQAASYRAQGRDSLVASRYRAFTSIASGLNDMSKTAASGGKP
jgi:hypothetical protein